MIFGISMLDSVSSHSLNAGTIDAEIGADPLLPRNGFKASAASAGVAYRSSGNLASMVSKIFWMPAGTSETIVETRGGFSVACFNIWLMMLLSGKGACPHRQWNKTQPVL